LIRHDELNGLYFSDTRYGIGCDRGSTKQNEKCPVQIADLVLIHNYIMDSLSKPDKDINEDFNFWALVPSLKDSYLKFCKVFETRIRVVLADYRVISQDEEQATTVKVKGVIQQWVTRKAMNKQMPSDLTLELQFLEAHRKQYTALAADFASISYSPKSKTALENFKELILLDLKILLGADIPWQHSGKQPDIELHADSLAALPHNSADDDKSASSSDERPAAAASGGPSQDPGPHSCLDPTNFLTWTPTNWDAVEFDKISFPADQTPLMCKSFYAVAVLFLNFLHLRTKYKTVWDQLTSAWASTFGKKLTNETLGSPPSEGPHAFTSDEREWCEQTLRFINGGSDPAAPARRSSTRNAGAAAGAAAGPATADGGKSSNAAARKNKATNDTRQYNSPFFSLHCFHLIILFI
jgi:hypothetical protein